MSATVNVEELNGSGPTATVITTGRYATTDSYNPGDSYPCVVPDSGFNYSYWKHHRIAFSGTFTQISNIRWFTSGNIASNWNLGTAGILMVGLRDSGDNGCPSGSYDQATGVQGTSGHAMDDPTNGHTYYKGQTTPYGDADDYLSSSELLVDSTEYTATGSSKSVVTQVMIDDDAVQGDKPTETLTFRYDEI